MYSIDRLRKMSEAELHWYALRHLSRTDMVDGLLGSNGCI